MSKKPSKLYVVSWGPDSRHLHNSTVFQGAADAKCHYLNLGYMFAKPVARKLVKIEYKHRMSNGDKITVLAEHLI